MQFHKLYSPTILSLILLLIVSIPSAIYCTNSTETFPQNETSHRNSRQLFSLIKNIIQQSQNPSQQQQPQVQLQHAYPQPQQYLQPQQYPQQGYYQGQQYSLQDPGLFYPPAEEKIHNVGSPTQNLVNYPQPQSQQQYPMLNYPMQQHSSVPYYQENSPIGVHQLQKNPGISQSPSNNNGGLGGLLSGLLQSQNGGGSGGESTSNNGNILSKLVGSGLGLPIPEDLDLSSLSSLINFNAFEGMLGKVNQFDKLQCIPRMICQMVAKRNEDEALRASTSTTTSTTTTQRSVTKKKKKSRKDSARFIKIGGVDTALDQFVKFLELMQLKDWSVYPYVKGMYEGNNVKRSTECAEKFHSCPFSDDQLVYYFNNYNGGFFQSFRSGRNFNFDNATSIEEEKLL